jgi:hypothetical protein
MTDKNKHAEDWKKLPGFTLGTKNGDIDEARLGDTIMDLGSELGEAKSPTHVLTIIARLEAQIKILKNYNDEWQRLMSKLKKEGKLTEDGQLKDVPKKE